MTRDETIQLMMMMQAAYPNFRVQNKEITVNLWQSMLEEYPFNVVQVAFKSYIATSTSGFAPDVGQFINQIHNIQQINNEDKISDAEAWGMVYKAICNANYHAREEFEKLPIACQKAVGTPSVLKEWAMMDIETINSVIQSNFLRTYKIEDKRQEDLAKLPKQVRDLLLDTSNSLKLEKE